MHRATDRATLAGVGTTGSLVAAVMAVAAVTAGVVTFTAWPDSPAHEPSPVVQLQQRPVTRPGPTAGPIALPTGVAAALVGGGVGVHARGTTGPGVLATPLGGRAIDRQSSLAQPERTAAQGGAGHKPPKPVGDPGPLKPVVDVATKASENLGTSVKTGGTAAGDATSSLSPLIGTAVGTIAGITGDGVAKAGSVLADLLRRIGGGRAGT
jgi:hypothetical protein